MTMVQSGNSNRFDFEETELRLGLPSGSGGGAAAGGGGEKIINGKRGYEETMDLKLKLGAKEMENINDHLKQKSLHKDQYHNNLLANDSMKPPAKAQVVGWPPVRSFRKNIMAVKKSGDAVETEKSCGGGGAAALVKVSMDGAPYLRKVDLNMYNTYQQLSDALAKMFSSFTIGKCEGQGMMDSMNESKLMGLLNSCEYVPTYEDKDGDWMLVGDVPWEMFVGSCKRLRIMKGTEAKGLAPRAMGKMQEKKLK